MNTIFGILFGVFLVTNIKILWDLGPLSLSTWSLLGTLQTERTPVSHRPLNCQHVKELALQCMYFKWWYSVVSKDSKQWCDVRWLIVFHCMLWIYKPTCVFSVVYFGSLNVNEYFLFRSCHFANVDYDLLLKRFLLIYLSIDSVSTRS